MDSRHFDHLIRALGKTSARRDLLRLLVTLPVLGGLLARFAVAETDAKGRRKRHKKPHHHRKKSGNRAGNKKKRRCNPESTAKTCAGRCGSVKSSCQKMVACGSCDCQESCPVCFTCQAGGPNTPSACLPDPAREGQECGAPGQVCQGDGACVCDADSCAPCETCQENGRCSLPCDGSGCCDANGECQGGDDQELCGRTGETCISCEGQEICRADGQGGTCRVNQAPEVFSDTVNDEWGKACIVLTLRGADPDDDPLAFRLGSEPVNGRLFLYDDDEVDFLGAEVRIGDPAVPAEAGTDNLRLCYKTDNRFFFGQDSFRYIASDTHGAESPAKLIQITVFET